MIGSSTWVTIWWQNATLPQGSLNSQMRVQYFGHEPLMASLITVGAELVLVQQRSMAVGMSKVHVEPQVTVLLLRQFTSKHGLLVGSLPKFSPLTPSSTPRVTV